jgi:hypothetical protein
MLVDHADFESNSIALGAEIESEDAVLRFD